MEIKETAKDVLKVDRKTFVNPRAWIGYDGLKDQTRGLKDIIKTFFSQPRAHRAETYEQALQRLKTTDEEVQQRGTNYLLFAWVFLLLGVSVLSVGIYYLINAQAYLGFILSLGILTVLLSLAFQNHFYYFQIKHRKLGCTFEEWRNGRPN